MAAQMLSEHQPSLTEWLKQIGKEEEYHAVRAEDDTRTERFNFLFQTIGLPCDMPEIFSATELKQPTARFAELLSRLGDQSCAIRLIPRKKELPKLRMRGLPLRECYEQWFLKQPINSDDYTAEVFRHRDEKAWSTTFIVNEQGIFGEIIRGSHHQLTQGVTTEQPLQFSYDFVNWQWSVSHANAEQQLKSIVNHALVTDVNKQKLLHGALGVRFFHNFIEGYYEATVWGTGEIWFIDYNRLLARYAPATSVMNKIGAEQDKSSIRGASAFPGMVTGYAVVMADIASESIQFNEGDILISDNTDVRYLPYMQRAGAIVANRGGILSHAAIVARELKKPCIVGTQNATTFFKTGDLVEVNANLGRIKKL